ncbi:MAG: MerR family DNA-binding transcriptional regulator [Solirubrobacterales bacterium]|nr:MerR family DNA-binding transcriptional regulator [Solirubrobacterales bacterium]
MSGIRTNAAAGMLGVSPNTLRSWERRYGFPRPHRSPGGHRQYALTEIESLRATLAETHNVSSAISLARERGAGPSSAGRLAEAFSNFEEDKANRMLEESLTLRSLERTIEEMLLCAVETHHSAERTGASAEYEFAWRHATGWLSALKRLSPPASRDEGILLIDASASGDLDALHAQALELILRRAGLRTLLLSAAVDTQRLGRALRALTPSGLVLAGQRASLEMIGRIVYAVRGVSGGLLVFDFRGAVPDTGASTVFRLGDKPVGARDQLLTKLDELRTAAASGDAGAVDAHLARMARGRTRG